MRARFGRSRLRGCSHSRIRRSAAGTRCPPERRTPRDFSPGPLIPVMPLAHAEMFLASTDVECTPVYHFFPNSRFQNRPESLVICRVFANGACVLPAETRSRQGACSESDPASLERLDSRFSHGRTLRTSRRCSCVHGIRLHGM